MTIRLYGRIPSKKNSTWTKIISGKPVRLTSQKHKEWHKDALKQLQGQGVKQSKLSGVHITYQFYAPDKRQTDFSNKIESVNDLLVDYGFLEDDSWFHLVSMSVLPIKIWRKNPGVEIKVKKVKSKTGDN